jgi:ABC-type molybdate transport system ATPase subunit
MRNSESRFIENVLSSHAYPLRPVEGIQYFIETHGNDITIIVLDGRTSDLDKIADNITLIQNGNIFHSGTKEGLLESYRIIKGNPKDLQSALCERIIRLTADNGCIVLVPCQPFLAGCMV